MASKKEILQKKINLKNARKKVSLSQKNNNVRKTKSKRKISNVNNKKIQKNVIEKQKSGTNAIVDKNSNVKKLSNKRTKKIKESLKAVVRYLNARKKVLILSILITLLAGIVIYGLKDTTKKIFLTFKSYSVGDYVTLKDDSTWYVIEDSNEEDNLVKLLSENVIDLNNDGKIDDKDKMAYDSSNAYEYDIKNDKNIGYFLENELIDKFADLGGVKELRLLRSDEYISVRKKMDFGYDWKEGNWLASEDLDHWWLETSSHSKIYVVTKRGSYRLLNANSKNYVRPVIVIDKDNIK